MIEDDYAVNTTPEQQAEFHLWFPKLIPAEETSIGDIQALIGFKEKSNRGCMCNFLK